MPSATLNLALTGPPMASPGTNLTYSVTLNSTGPNAAQGVSLNTFVQQALQSAVHGDKEGWREAKQEWKRQWKQQRWEERRGPGGSSSHVRGWYEG